VFDRYSKVNTVGTKKVGSTGIGMSISEKIMQAHGGQIGFYKNQGAGTTFFLELALYPRQADNAEKQKPGKKGVGTAA
jgi:signal transduction histidine kinase